MTIMLEEDKYYKLRSGVTVGPLKRQEGFSKIFFSKNGHYGAWWEHGRRFSGDRETPDDIVEEAVMPNVDNKQNSPVKTVTRKEISMGNYGAKNSMYVNHIKHYNQLEMQIRLGFYTKEELKEFAQLLNEISEAM